MKKIHLNISMSPEVRKHLEALQVRTNAMSLSEVFRAALANYEFSLDAKERRIIDNDVDSYTAFFENHKDALRRCVPSEEQRNAELADAAAQVVSALKNYKFVVDGKNGVSP